jgi:trans-aconitate methyltransferase
MEFKGPAVYDNNDFFQNYLSRRNREDSPNNIIEKPALLELIGDVAGKQILDLGCGDARFGDELLKQGCSFYEGVEGSKNMVNEAMRVLVSERTSIHHSTMEDWSYPCEKYDLVISRLAIHYLQDLEPVFRNVRNSLNLNGQFVFSVQHPVLTSSMKSIAVSGKKADWIVDDYFEIGERTEPWIRENVIKYHRTIEEYYRALKNSGFKIEDISECKPQPERFNNTEEYKRRLRIPLFLLFRCLK